MAATGKAVFGADWPAVRAELTEDLQDDSIERRLGDFSRGGRKVIKLKSVKGGEVELRAHIDDLQLSDSDAQTEIYSGPGKFFNAQTVSTQSHDTQALAQAQRDLLPGVPHVNVTAQGQVNAAFGNETTHTHVEAASSNTLFRKKGSSVTHLGTATVSAAMSRPPKGSEAAARSDTADARVTFITRELPADEQVHGSFELAEGSQLSPATLVRKILDGRQFRDEAIRNIGAMFGLRQHELNAVTPYIEASLRDSVLEDGLTEMTRKQGGWRKLQWKDIQDRRKEQRPRKLTKRVWAGDYPKTTDDDRMNGVTLLTHEKYLITASAKVGPSVFVGVEHDGANAYLQNDVSQGRQTQQSRSRQAGGRLLIGPHAKFLGIDFSALLGGGGSRQWTRGVMFSDNSRILASAKVPRAYGVLNVETEITLIMRHGGDTVELPPQTVHGQVLIPLSELEAAAKAAPVQPGAAMAGEGRRVARRRGMSANAVRLNEFGDVNDHRAEEMVADVTARLTREKTPRPVARVWAAYDALPAELQRHDWRRQTPAMRDFLYNQVLTGHPYVRLKGGAPSGHPEDRADSGGAGPSQRRPAAANPSPTPHPWPPRLKVALRTNFGKRVGAGRPRSGSLTCRLCSAFRVNSSSL